MMLCCACMRCAPAVMVPAEPQLLCTCAAAAFTAQVGGSLIGLAELSLVALTSAYLSVAY